MRYFLLKACYMLYYEDIFFKKTLREVKCKHNLHEMCRRILKHFNEPLWDYIKALMSHVI